MSNGLNKISKINILIGAILIASSILPISLLFQFISQGMFGPVFGKMPSIIYRITSTIFTYTITGLAIYYLSRKINFNKRFNPRYASTSLFAIGNITIISYTLLYFYATTIPGGGMSFALSAVGAYPVTIATIILYIALARVLIGIEPESGIPLPEKV
jgi:hypothetical protein